MKKLTKEQKQEIKRLSVIKWEWIVKNPEYSMSDIEKALPELIPYRDTSHCPYCSVYINLGSKCKGCPVRVKSIPCYDKGHPYYEFFKLDNQFDIDSMSMSDAAQSVLDVIMKINV